MRLSTIETGLVVDGVLAAVNHSGDSDSTGAITGNLPGVALGTGSIPPSLVGDVAPT